MNFKPHITYLLVFIISVLLLTHLFFTLHYSTIIANHTRTLKKAEQIRLRSKEINRWMNLMDMSLLSYALSPNQSSKLYFDSAYYLMDSTLLFLETSLKTQDFPMHDFYALEDSILAYMNLGRHMFQLLETRQKNEDIVFLQHGHGKKAWTYYKNASIRIENFENDIIQRAGEQHLAAVQRNNYIYIVMLLLVLPTLFYTAFHSVKSYRYSEKHRLTAQSRNQLLTDQNELLEKRVSERTSVIREKNIALENAMQYIKEQHQMISDQNVRLGEEVERQTRKLQLANEELEDRIAKMEEYSFVISHKLRSPVANLMGLSELIELQQTEKNEKFIQYIGESARELDNILRDLNDFLLLEKAELHFTTVDLKSCIQHAKSQLRKEIEESQVEMSEELQVEYFQSQQSLLTKIIYNLLSNAIRFRYPGREHQVSIKSRKQEDQIIIEFRDNGLGINLKRYQKKLFQPYQRFHNHAQGKGVGLYLARLMAEKLGGSLGVESEVYEGSVFILKLPGQQS